MPAAEPPRLPPHPGMTLAVYRVTSDGERRPVRATRFQPSSTTAPDLTGCWPPCRCPRCRGRRRSP